MKSITRKLMPLAIALGMAFATSAANAAPTPFVIQNGSAANLLVSGATSLDWKDTGSGVAIGIGPFGKPIDPTKPFEFRYQAALSSISDNGDASVVRTALATDLDNSSNGKLDPGTLYEYTIVAKLIEQVDYYTGNTAVFKVAGLPSQNKVSIFFDTKGDAKTSDGTGFDNGVQVAQFTVIQAGSTSSFTPVSATTGNGTARMHAIIDVANGDFVNPNYLQGVTSLIVSMDYEGTLNYPAGNSTTTGFHRNTPDDATADIYGSYTVTPADILFAVQGKTTFGTNAVPEPGSMMLFGVGLLGAVGAIRRRKQIKA